MSFVNQFYFNIPLPVFMYLHKIAAISRLIWCYLISIGHYKMRLYFMIRPKGVGRRGRKPPSKNLPFSKQEIIKS